VWVQINWQTGAHEQFWYQRRVRSYAEFADAQALEQRVRDLSAAGFMDAQIAAVLTEEGYQTPGLIHPITSKMVWHLREESGRSRQSNSTRTNATLPNGKMAPTRLKALQLGWEWTRHDFPPG